MQMNANPPGAPDAPGTPERRPKQRHANCPDCNPPSGADATYRKVVATLRASARRLVGARSR